MLTVLLPENRYSPPLRELLEPLLPEGSVFRDPDAGLEALTDHRAAADVSIPYRLIERRSVCFMC